MPLKWAVFIVSCVQKDFGTPEVIILHYIGMHDFVVVVHALALIISRN
jgi:hypothetical protein